MVFTVDSTQQYQEHAVPPSEDDDLVYDFLINAHEDDLYIILEYLLELALLGEAHHEDSDLDASDEEDDNQDLLSLARSNIPR